MWDQYKKAKQDILAKNRCLSLFQSGDSNNIPLSSEEQQSIYYMKVPNIKNEGDQVEELPIGAIPVNPN